MTFNAVTIGDRDIKLRYRAESIMSIEKLAGKKIGQAGLKFIQKQAGIEFSSSDKIPIELVMGFMDMDFDTMLWIWSYGLDWKESGAKQSEVNALYDAYMEMEDPDGGGRFKAFKMLAIDAINVARGIDTKKLQAANLEAREKQIIDQEQTIAREKAIRLKARDTTGSEQPDSASET